MSTRGPWSGYLIGLAFLAVEFGEETIAFLQQHAMTAGAVVLAGGVLFFLFKRWRRSRVIEPSVVSLAGAEVERV